MSLCESCPKENPLKKASPKYILDACCGGRMMWKNKNHPNTVYIDQRITKKGLYKQRPNFQVLPDIKMDFRAMAFNDKTFKLIVMDPPHLSTFTDTSIMKKKYGALNAETWQYDLTTAFKECWRVLDDYGSLIIKWNDTEIPYKKLLKLFKEDPLFYNITAGPKTMSKKGPRSYWFTFMKIPIEEL